VFLGQGSGQIASNNSGGVKENYDKEESWYNFTNDLEDNPIEEENNDDKEEESWCDVKNLKKDNHLEDNPIGVASMGDDTEESCQTHVDDDDDDDDLEDNPI